ncbi:MAG: hypothetical protein Q3959_06055 [Limosilactobacillus sp.]|uniref:hypothetical protein n=1 Tax=Limosilactobacillus sp. TaxID=2773925 RepID=UPI00270B0961|nr:hypothetical protein [Limosilactobacillus sp.]
MKEFNQIEKAFWILKHGVGKADHTIKVQDIADQLSVSRPTIYALAKEPEKLTGVQVDQLAAMYDSYAQFNPGVIVKAMQSDRDDFNQTQSELSAYLAVIKDQDVSRLTVAIAEYLGKALSEEDSPLLKFLIESRG